MLVKSLVHRPRRKVIGQILRVRNHSEMNDLANEKLLKGMKTITPSRASPIPMKSCQSGPPSLLADPCYATTPDQMRLIPAHDLGIGTTRRRLLISRVRPSRGREMDKPALFVIFVLHILTRPWIVILSIGKKKQRDITCGSIPGTQCFQTVEVEPCHSHIKSHVSAIHETNPTES